MVWVYNMAKTCYSYAYLGDVGLVMKWMDIKTNPIPEIPLENGYLVKAGEFIGCAEWKLEIGFTMGYVGDWPGGSVMLLRGGKWLNEEVTHWMPLPTEFMEEQL